MERRKLSPTDALLRRAQNAEDLIRKADEALKEAIEARVRLGAAGAIEELRALATWVPGSFLQEFDLSTGSNMTEEERNRLRTAPFVSEAYLYPLLGKDKARTFLGMFDAVCRALGARGGASELQEPWYAARLQEARELAAASTAHVKELREAGHSLANRVCSTCGDRTCKRQLALRTYERAVQVLKDEWEEEPPV